MRPCKALSRIVLALALVLPATAIAGKGDNLRLTDKLASLLPRNARWALAVTDLATGKETMNIGSAQADALIPGSLIKLLTAGALFDYTARRGGLNMKTAILHDGTYAGDTLDGNLYLVGRGNPLLNAADLRGAAGNLAASGVRRITGDIVADDAFLDTRGLERSGKGPGHAPAGALGLDLHTVAVTVTPTEPGTAPRVAMEPQNDMVRLAVEARTVAEAENAVLVTRIDDTAYRVSGTIPAGSAPLKQRFALQDPALYAAGALATSLSQARVTVGGIARKGGKPGDAKLLAEIEGPDQQTLVRDMNVNSLNVVADNLLLLLGAERQGGPGTREHGVMALYDFLGSLGLIAAEMTIADGSGLSEGNRVTAKFMADYLGKVAEKKWFQSFLGSLPRAGMDGTLREIGYRNERFRAKSGRLENAFALAGYGVNANNKELAFAVIINAPGAGALHLERCGAEVMRYLAEKP